MKKPRIAVSDHALVRYFERVLQMDIEGVRREIGHKVENGVDLGASGVRIDGFTYKLKGAVVTTVTPACTPERGHCPPRAKVGAHG